MLLDHLEPQRVFYYFEQICRIPHGSGNTKQISDYLVSFAREHQLFCIQDKLNNVIIIKEASDGYEREPAIILQGHMDMVAVKDEGCQIDLEKDGLDLCVEDDMVFAKGTSLGADDGIFVAYALAILESGQVRHPRLEVVFTVDEEVGMEGALSIDLSILQGRRLLNIDSEKQGELTVSCAGGIRVTGVFRNVMETIPLSGDEQVYHVELTGLCGGHSGTEIHHGRANANIEMGRLLGRLCRDVAFRLICMEGGTKDNVIPAHAKAELMIQKSQSGLFEKLLMQEENELRKKYQKTDPGLLVTFDTLPAEGSVRVFKEDAADCVLDFLSGVKNGVQSMSTELPGLVETSLNLGVIAQTKEELRMTFSIRSSRKNAKDKLREELCEKLKEAGADVSLGGDYPAWEMNKNSELVVQMQKLYTEMFHEPPVVLSVHAGLECGILADKLKGLDSVSFGPDIFDIHTTKERLSITSTAQMWRFLVALLGQKR